MAKKPVPPPPTPEEKLDAWVLASALNENLPAPDLAEIAAYWVNKRDERLLADKLAEGLKSWESKAQALLLEQFGRQKDLGGVNTAFGRVGMNPEPTNEPHVTDWPKFYEYILETKDFSLLERRPGRAAVKERWEDDVVVPGVEKFPVYKLTRTKK